MGDVHARARSTGAHKVILEMPMVTSREARQEGLALVVALNSSGCELGLYDPGLLYNAIISAIDEEKQVYCTSCMRDIDETITDDVFVKLCPHCGSRTISRRYPSIYELCCEFEDFTLGSIGAHRRGRDTYEISWSWARSGYGPLMYDMVMSFGSYVMSDRNAVSRSASRVWKHYQDERLDVSSREAGEGYSTSTMLPKHHRPWLDREYKRKKPLGIQSLVKNHEKCVRDIVTDLCPWMRGRECSPRGVSKMIGTWVEAEL